MRARIRIPLLIVVCVVTVVAAVVSVFRTITPALADPVSGAIFTTNASGTEVNENIYASKQDVYLDGGPGAGAPATAAGLPDGTYVFQVTNPSGKTLLSTDNAACREFVVSGGIITGVVAAGGCEHATAPNATNNGVTVQLFPFNDTPNNGGEYKVWVTSEANFLAGCSALGVSNGLSVVNCGFAPANDHGFIPSDSKTDNFKVKVGPSREIDTQFISLATNQPIDGLGETWTDTLGASNTKWQYTNPSIGLYHFAHIEAAEPGTHQISISNEAGCTISEVDTQFPGQPIVVVGTGPVTVSVTVPTSNSNHDMTWYIFVYCS